MKIIDVVYGCEETAQPIVIGKDTVYVHSNIEKFTPEGEDNKEMYKYHEIQYTLKEWAELLKDQQMSKIAAAAKE